MGQTFLPGTYKPDATLLALAMPMAAVSAIKWEKKEFDPFEATRSGDGMANLNSRLVIDWTAAGGVLKAKIAVRGEDF